MPGRGGVSETNLDEQPNDRRDTSHQQERPELMPPRRLMARAKSPAAVQLEVEQVGNQERHDPHQRCVSEVELGAGDGKGKKDALGVDGAAVGLVHNDRHQHVHHDSGTADQAELDELSQYVAVPPVDLAKAHNCEGYTPRAKPGYPAWGVGWH